MNGEKIIDGVYWVGAIDWNVRNFHGYHTPRGTTYNAYLITGDKNILVDTVKKPFLKELLERISSIIDPKDIDVIVSNHTEMDHSGCLPELQAITGATVLASKKGVEGLKMHFPELRTEEVKDGQEIKCGSRTLKFIDTPMLHWPDSMFTYIPEDGLLFSMDAFGQHYAVSKRFNDEVDQTVLYQEAQKYYANIITPFSARVIKTLEKAKDLNIRILATSHGVIWRTDLDKIISLYSQWASNKTPQKALIIYDSMWGSTGIMAKEIAEGIASEGVTVEIIKLSETDRSEAMARILTSRAVIIGTPTLNNNMFPTVADMAVYMKGLRPKGRIGAAFGSFGWAGGAVKDLQNFMKDGGLDMPFEPLEVQYVPDAAAKQRCFDFGKEIALKVKSEL